MYPFARIVGGCDWKKGVTGAEIPLGALDLKVPPPGVPSLVKKKHSAPATEISEPEYSYQEEPEPMPQTEISDHGLAGLFSSITNVKPGQLFQLPGEIGKWLGKMERYRNVIILHGERGGGKSNLVYDLMDSFSQLPWVRTVGFFSLEEGANTDLVKRKRDKYFGEDAKRKVVIADEAPEGINTVRRAAQFMDVVVVDSYGKLNAPQQALDQLRKDFPNTVFIFVFQTTTNGNARGGSSASFDCSVEIIVQKSDDGDFRNNTAYLEKNRYAATGTRYNVYSRKLIPVALPAAKP